MPRPHARIARVAALALATLVAATTVATASAAPHRPAPGSGAEPRSKIRWHRCERQLPASLRCGEQAVPLDYRHPRAAKIRLGFNRLRAQDRNHRVGSLIVNPGGPGGTGSDVVAVEAAGAGLWHPAPWETASSTSLGCPTAPRSARSTPSDTRGASLPWRSTASSTTRSVPRRCSPTRPSPTRTRLTV